MAGRSSLACLVPADPSATTAAATSAVNHEHDDQDHNSECSDNQQPSVHGDHLQRRWCARPRGHEPVGLLSTRHQTLWGIVTLSDHDSTRGYSGRLRSHHRVNYRLRTILTARPTIPPPGVPGGVRPGLCGLRPVDEVEVPRCRPAPSILRAVLSRLMPAVSQCGRVRAMPRRSGPP